MAPSLIEDDSLLLDLDGGSGKVSMDMDTPDGKITFEEDTKEEDDKGGGYVEKPTDNTEDTVEENISDLYSSIEIGKISGEEHLSNSLIHNC